MFEVLVAFGVPASVSSSRLLEILGALAEDELVVGHVSSGNTKPGARWFTLMGVAERSAEELVSELTTQLGSLTVVSAYDTSGLVAVFHHELGDSGVETTHEVVEDSASQKVVLGRELGTLYGKRAVAELKTAVDSWTYTNTVTGEVVSQRDVDKLDWAIDVGDAADTVFGADADDIDDGDDDDDDAEDDNVVPGETDADRERVRKEIAGLFGDYENIDPAIAASKQRREKGDYTWYSAEHYALESRQRWPELLELVLAALARGRESDRDSNRRRRFGSAGRPALNDARLLMGRDRKADAEALVRAVLERFPRAREYDGGDYASLYPATLKATPGNTATRANAKTRAKKATRPQKAAPRAKKAPKKSAAKKAPKKNAAKKNAAKKSAAKRAASPAKKAPRPSKKTSKAASKATRR